MSNPIGHFGFSWSTKLKRPKHQHYWSSPVHQAGLVTCSLEAGPTPTSEGFALNKRAAALSPKEIFLPSFWELHLPVAFLCLDHTVSLKLLFDSHQSLQLQCSPTEFNKWSKVSTRGWLILGGPWAASCHPVVGHLSYAGIRAQANTRTVPLPGLAAKQSPSCVAEQLLIFPTVLRGTHKKKMIFF